MAGRWLPFPPLPGQAERQEADLSEGRAFAMSGTGPVMLLADRSKTLTHDESRPSKRQQSEGVSDVQ